MRRSWLAALMLILAILSGCKKDAEPISASSDLPPGELKIFAIESFRSSGFEAILHKDFASRYNCSFEVQTFPTITELLEAATADSAEVDIVVGIPGSFAYDDSLQEHFTSIRNFLVSSFVTELKHKAGSKLIPYGYGKLAIVYNTRQLEIPPQTFGDLQDARYISQMAITDPLESGLGRSTLHWTVSLFGEHGYKMLWRSLRKNVGKQYSSPDDAIKALREGRYAMILGLNTTAAWIKEQDHELDYFKTVIPGEGTYIHAEYAALHRNSTSAALAQAYLEYLLSPAAQKLVIYKLGLLPANSKAELPLSFARLPLYSHSTNDRLDKATILTNQEAWLDYFSDLFAFRIN